MTISLVVTGTPVISGTGATVAAPNTLTGVAAGDLLLLFVTAKLDTAAMPTISGWTKTIDVVTGTGSAGSGVGPHRQAVYQRLYDGTETSSIPITTSPASNVIGAVIQVWRSGTTTFEPLLSTSGTDTTSNTTVFVTGATNLSLAANDVLINFIVASANVSFASPTTSATGATTSTTVERVDVGSTTGNRIRLVLTDVLTITGGPSTAAPSTSNTSSGNTTGGVVFIRLREGLAPTALLTDDFSTQNTTKWTGYGTDIVASGGRLNVNAATSYPALKSVAKYNLTGSSISVEAVTMPSPGSGSVEAYFYLITDPTASVFNGSALAIVWTPYGLFLREVVAGTASDVTITYNAVAHRWWRIREAAGTVYWETSPDRTTWTVQRSKAPGIAVTSLAGVLMAGDYGTNPVTPAVFDNVNTAPVSSATVTGNWTFAGAIVGKRTPKASTLGTWTFAGAIVGKRVPKATEAGEWTFSGAIAGTRTPKAAVTGETTWSGSIVGSAPPVSGRSATVTGTTNYSGTVVGRRTPKSTVTGTATFSGAVVGKRTPRSTVEGTTTWSGSAAGKRVPQAAVVGTLTWATAVIGRRRPVSQLTGNVAWSGSIIGAAPIVGGKSGAVLGNTLWKTTIVGGRPSRAAVVGATNWSGSIGGVRPVLPVAAATVSGSVGWQGTMVGHRTARATITGALAYAGSIVGVRRSSAVVAGDTVWLGELTGRRDSAATLTGATVWVTSIVGGRPNEPRDVLIEIEGIYYRPLSGTEIKLEHESTAGVTFIEHTPIQIIGMLERTP